MLAQAVVGEAAHIEATVDAGEGELGGLEGGDATGLAQEGVVVGEEEQAAGGSGVGKAGGEPAEAVPEGVDEVEAAGDVRSVEVGEAGEVREAGEAGGRAWGAVDMLAGVQVGKGSAAAILGEALQLVDLLGDAAGAGDDAGEGEDDEGRHLAADDQHDGKQRQAAHVVAPAAAQEEVGAGGGGGGSGGSGGWQGAHQLPVGVEVAQAGLVKGEIGLAGGHQVGYGGGVGAADGQVQRRRPGGAGGVGGIVSEDGGGGGWRGRGQRW